MHTLKFFEVIQVAI